MINKLMNFYYDHQTRPFVWGEWDCSIVAQAWIEYATGKKFNIPVCKSLKAYHTFDIVGTMDASLNRTVEPFNGDIAVFMNHINLLTIGIVCNDRIMSIDESGLIVLGYTPKITWSLR